MRAYLPLACLLLSCHPGNPSPPPTPAAPRVTARYRPELSATPLDGRLLVIFAQDAAREPRRQVRDDDGSAQVFGVDVVGWAPGQETALHGDVVGYPLASLADVPPGDYWVQAVLHRYETFRRADGYTVSLPPDRGEGQNWSLAPGNLMSTPRRMRVDATTSIAIDLDQAIPLLPPMLDTPYLRHVQLRSEKLSRFWGRDVYLNAIVLLPEGWEAHPTARYPLIIYHSHFERELQGYRGTPPEDGLPAPNLEALRRECPNGHTPGCDTNGYKRYVQEAGWRFHQQWTSKSFPRVLLVQIQHANPYYDDSYAVNSANLGPYGDAITHELVPYLEEKFRGLGPWARGMYGGSTGGWEALAAQVFYPDEYNGIVANCPDPVDFRAYMTVDIYRDENGHYSKGPFRRTPRVGERDDDGSTRSTIEQLDRFELALGTRSRSGQQLDIWEAVYSPVGADGYPKRIWDKSTGAIDAAVARHWRDNYDLSHIIARDWSRLGPKLAGKLRINAGNMDNYFLDLAVRRLEERMRGLDHPKSDAVFDYGARDGHCWSGDHEHMNFESRLTYHARFIPLLVERFLRTAPPGADTRSWRY